MKGNKMRSDYKIPVSLELLELGFSSEQISNLFQYYNEEHRYYHNWDHIVDLLEQFYKLDFTSPISKEIVFLSILFHDIIYDPLGEENEEKSAELFKKWCPGGRSSRVKREVVECILSTKTHLPKTKNSSIVCSLDLSILTRPLDELIEFEHKIFKEYQFADYSIYKERRVEVLRELQQKFNDEFERKDQIENLILYIESRRPILESTQVPLIPFIKDT